MILSFPTTRRFLLTCLPACLLGMALPGALRAEDVMTPGCATCDAEMLLSDAVSLMTGRRMHRLVVTEKDQPVGVISMTDVVRKIIGE